MSQKTTNASAEKNNTTKKASKASAKTVSATLDKAVANAEAKKPGVKAKYIYPEGMSAKDKKAFRRKARLTMKSFTKNLTDLSKSNKKEDQKELKKLQGEKAQFEKSTYLAK